SALARAWPADELPLPTTPPIGSGGEGEVYALPGYPGYVVKIFLRPLSPYQIQRQIRLLRQVQRLRGPAFPGQVLRYRGGRVGFVMERLPGDFGPRSGMPRRSWAAAQRLMAQLAEQRLMVWDFQWIYDSKTDRARLIDARDIQEAPTVEDA